MEAYKYEKSFLEAMQFRFLKRIISSFLAKERKFPFFQNAKPNPSPFYFPVPRLHRGGPAQGHRGGEAGHPEAQVPAGDEEVRARQEGGREDAQGRAEHLHLRGGDPGPQDEGDDARVPAPQDLVLRGRQGREEVLLLHRQGERDQARLLRLCLRQAGEWS